MGGLAHREVQKIYQLSVFLENRVGVLLQLSKLLDLSGLHICAVSIVDTADTAIVRLVVDNVAKAKRILKERGLSCYETELIGVQLPLGEGIDISSVLGILLRAEINIHYVYALIIRIDDRPVLALHVDHPDLAARILLEHGLEIVGQDEIRREEDEGI